MIDIHMHIIWNIKMDIYKVENFTKEWILYANKCKVKTNKHEYMLCDALTKCNLNFANALLDLDLIKDLEYVHRVMEWNATALIIVACNGDLIIIKKLKDKGANLNAYNGGNMNNNLFHYIDYINIVNIMIFLVIISLSPFHHKQ